MKIGTESLLYGAHLFWWHPFFVARAWYKLYGWNWVEYCFAKPYAPNDPWRMRTSLKDWRLWLAFIVHDWGYWGSKDMDGEDGIFHPMLGDAIMYGVTGGNIAWSCFMLYHSRGMAQRHGRRVSPLAAADKLSLALEPWWFYLYRVRMTGEIREYQSTERHGPGFVGYDLPKQGRSWEQDKQWWMEVRRHLRTWAQKSATGFSIFTSRRVTATTSPVPEDLSEPSNT